MEVQDAKPVFVVLEPASYPNKPKPGRAVKVLLYGLCGFILSGLWAMFGEEFSKNWKKNWAIVKNKKN